MRKIKKLHIHHTECPTNWFNGKNQDKLMEQCRRWHLDRGFQDIGYHFMIFPDGSLREGRSIDIKPASIKWHNVGAIAICVWGNFDIEEIKYKQYTRLYTFTKSQIDLYKLNPDKDIIFHRDYNKNKYCPGRNIVKMDFIKDVKNA